MAVAMAAPAAAQDDDLPSLEFLEYLGSWEESDEEWLVVAEEFMGQPAADSDEITELDGADDNLAGDEQTRVDESRDDETDDNDED